MPVCPSVCLCRWDFDVLDYDPAVLGWAVKDILLRIGGSVDMPKCQLHSFIRVVEGPYLSFFSSIYLSLSNNSSNNSNNANNKNRKKHTTFNTQPIYTMIQTNTTTTTTTAAAAVAATTTNQPINQPTN